tara:strand:+ start:479 stop:1285 length:807 start_codon:yes stop_codon:yes gene_type:complete
MLPLFSKIKYFQKNRKVSAIYLSTLLCLFATSQQAFSDLKLDKSLNQAQKMITEGQSSQHLIDKTIDETNALNNEFKRLSNSLEQININLSHQQQLHQQQVKQISSLENQLADVSNTEDAIIPLMLKMIDWLDMNIDADLPFHLDERNKRIESLKKNIFSPDLPLADIYRSVLDAYQVESEFGYNIESYHQSIELNGQIIESQILRVGRVGLYYLTLDGLQGGFWDKQTKQWQAVKGDSLSEINQGILIAKKQLPHNLLALPLSVGGK